MCQGFGIVLSNVPGVLGSGGAGGWGTGSGGDGTGVGSRAGTETEPGLAVSRRSGGCRACWHGTQAKSKKILAILSGAGLSLVNRPRVGRVTALTGLVQNLHFRPRSTWNQGLTRVHFSAQLDRFVGDRGCA
jgi:hypothetical protein